MVWLKRIGISFLWVTLPIGLLVCYFSKDNPKAFYRALVASTKEHFWG